MKHVQYLEERLHERLSRSLRERTEPLHTLITKAAAKTLREVTGEANAETPQDGEQARKACLKNPKGAIGLMVSHGSSLEQVAVFIAKRTLEKWVRILRPFASGPGLAMLISRLVHEDFSKVKGGVRFSETSSGEDESVIMEIIPPANDLLGFAFRQLTPLPDAAVNHPWIFVEDLESALNLEGQFNLNPDHPLRPNSGLSKTMSRTSSAMSRPSSRSENLASLSPKGTSGALRRSGAFPWADFQSETGNRQTTMVQQSHKQLRKFPGPDIYGDVAKTFNAPSRACWGRFPPAGGKRNPCSVTPLSHLSRYFAQEHVIS